MTNFNVALPSIRQLQTLIKNKTNVELKLTTGDIFTGKIVWQDENCLCLADKNNQQNLLWYQALVYIKPQS